MHSPPLLLTIMISGRTIAGTLGSGWSSLPSTQNLTGLFLSYNLLTGTDQ